MKPSRPSSIVHKIGLLVAWSWLTGTPALADVRLPHLIDSNMVIQRDLPLPIWGWADPGEEVTVKVGSNQGRTKANDQGKWMVHLAAMPAGGPVRMEIAGKNRIQLTNIMIGEVWICSGQSNMEMGIKTVRDGEKEVAQANYPNIRLFHPPWKTSGQPLDDLDAKWRPCSPENVAIGGWFGAGFPAVAYFFGREIHKETGLAVGIVATCWGGTRIEPWTPRAGFEMVPSLQDMVKVIDESTPKFNKAVADALKAYKDWLPVAQQALDQQRPVPAPPPWPKHLLEDNTQPMSIYNGMVHPLVPFGIRGVIWYQGESNNPDGMLYFDKMKALIGGWRKVWGQGDFPFYFTQLAPLNAIYEKDNLPRIWEAQTASLSIPNTGMAVTVDIGDLADIHPKNKQEVGKRLALWALAKTYGRSDLVYSGPLYKSMSVDGDKIRLRFDYVDGGLASRDGKPLTWFEIAGEDRKFAKAEATVDGQTVVVHSDAVPKPVAVRFAWNRAAEPNLMNKEGLPASPFRTDKW
jgi:sialate O-acetylesterase